jgi:hypothetical protein
MQNSFSDNYTKNNPSVFSSTKLYNTIPFNARFFGSESQPPSSIDITVDFFWGRRPKQTILKSSGTASTGNLNLQSKIDNF